MHYTLPTISVFDSYKTTNDSDLLILARILIVESEVNYNKDSLRNKEENS